MFYKYLSPSELLPKMKQMIDSSRIFFSLEEISDTNLNDFRNLLDKMASEVDFSLAKHDFLLASG